MSSKHPESNKVMVVVGTRPEAIKMAPVYNALKGYGKNILEPILVSTAQHREMLDQALDIFGLTPDIDLGIMEPGQSLFDVTEAALKRMERLLEIDRPDMVLVQGDTTTAMAASLAAFYKKIPTGHVEAGLRSFDRFNPYPEEVNRKIISSIADIHFAPTALAYNNLLAEGVPADDIFVTGNTIVDALKTVMDDTADLEIDGVDLERDRIILVTAHRRENWEGPLKNICFALKDLSRDFPDIQIVYPVHLNPAVQKVALEHLSGESRIHLIGPLDYRRFVQLMKRSYLILTDSGGVQEEAPSFGKPVLVMRKITERPEAYDAGLAKVVGYATEDILAEASLLLSSRKEYMKMVASRNPYGDGNASSRIAREVLNFIGKEPPENRLLRKSQNDICPSSSL